MRPSRVDGSWNTLGMGLRRFLRFASYAVRRGSVPVRPDAVALTWRRERFRGHMLATIMQAMGMTRWIGYMSRGVGCVTQVCGMRVVVSLSRGCCFNRCTALSALCLQLYPDSDTHTGPHGTRDHTDSEIQHDHTAVCLIPYVSAVARAWPAPCGRPRGSGTAWPGPAMHAASAYPSHCPGSWRVWCSRG